ncbi:MAG: hypothetical protein IT442_06485 [Phycisphaeraceae bacterium]|nr:hypothetical protein [Phycisphaeraceae bacterium]
MKQEAEAWLAESQRINTRWEQLYFLEKEAIDRAIKYLFYVNAGGAVAVLGFIGANQEISSLVSVKVTLSFFILGLLMVGCFNAWKYYSITSLFRHWREGVRQYYAGELGLSAIQKKDEELSSQECLGKVLAWGSFICIWAGCVSGAWAIFG